MSKIADLIIEILDLHDSGMSDVEISETLGVPVYFVSDAVADFISENEEFDNVPA